MPLYTTGVATLFTLQAGISIKENPAFGITFWDLNIIVEKSSFSTGWNLSEELGADSAAQLYCTVQT